MAFELIKDRTCRHHEYQHLELVPLPVPDGPEERGAWGFTALSAVKVQVIDSNGTVTTQTVARFLNAQFTVKLYRCPICGYVEMTDYD